MIAAETDLRTKAAGAPSLAELMLGRGDTLPRVAPRNIEQAVTKAEAAAQVVAEAEAITRDAAPIEATCGHASCAWAAGTVCRCGGCVGAGHGHLYTRAQNTGRATMQTRIDQAGGVFGTLPSVDLDASIVIVSGAFNPNPIMIDGESW